MTNQNENPSKDIVFDELPSTAEQLKALPYADLKDPYAVAAMCVCALNVFPTSKEESIAMMNVLKGPEPVSQFEIQFIRDRFAEGKEYKARSYFVGATPDNGYEPNKPYTVCVSENPYSRDEWDKGYLTVFLQSGGADSKRPLTLRTKKSTGEWFVSSDSYRGLLADIRIPKAEDPWA